MADSDWIKNRLPRWARFAKHGATTTVDQAVTAALGENADKFHALADLLEQLASNVGFERERQGEWEGEKSNLLSMADYWRGQSPNAGNAAGVFQNVPIKHGDTAAEVDDHAQT